jgi:hypothetical protein
MTNNSAFSSKWFIISLISHLFFLYLAIYGISFSSQDLKHQEEIISFEVLPASEISNVPNRVRKTALPLEKEIESKKVTKPQERPQVTKSISKEPTEPIKPEPPIDKKETPTAPKQTIDETIKSNDKEQLDKAESLESIKQDKKPEAPKPQEVPEAPKPQEVKQKLKRQSQQQLVKTDKASSTKENHQKNKTKAINDSELDSLMKTLEQASEGDNSKSRNHALKKISGEDSETSKGTYDQNKAFSLSEIAIIKQQIDKNWNRPIGAADIEDIKITIYIVLAEDGSVQEAEIRNVECGNASRELCGITADSALRAVRKASPLQNLSPERYYVWQKFNFLFTPDL